MAKSKSKNSVGHPVEHPYDPEMIRLATVACHEKGFDNKQLAKMFRISLSTLYRMFTDHPEFHQAVRAAKYLHDNHQVENALLKRAKGYKYKEKTRELRPGASEGDKPVMVTTKVVTKEVAPDTAAGKHWLNNRDPEKWAEKSEQEISISDKVADILLRRAEQYDKAKAEKRLKKGVQ